MLEANLHMLRQLVPGIELTLPTAGDEPELAAALPESGGLVVSGGNLSARHVALIEEARAAGLPVVVLGQTIGPSLTEDQLNLLSEALPYASWVGVREESSEKRARELGVAPDRIHHQLDDAFFIEPQVVVDERADVLRDAATPWILVTIDASYAAPEKESALRWIASQLDGLAESLKATLLFVPYAGGADVPPERSDLTVGRSLAALMRQPLVLLDLWQPREVRWLTGEAAMVVSTREHPLVFATAAGVPALGIYSDDSTRVKLRGALAWADLQDWCLSLADAAEGMLLLLAMELWHERDAVRKRLARLHAEAWPKEIQRWEAICQALHLPIGAEPAHPRTGERLQIVEQDKPRELPPHFDLHWWHYERNGFMRLGRLLDDEQLEALRRRIEDIQLGIVRYPAVRILEAPSKTDRTGRTVLGLEADPLVLDILRRDLFREICARQYGRHAGISVSRAMLESRPAGREELLPWRQDGAAYTSTLDRDPMVTVWIPLEPSTRPLTRLEIVPGSPRLGLIGDAVRLADVEKYCRGKAVSHLEYEAGEGFLLHSWLLQCRHASVPRNALTFSYVDARTVSAETGERFPVIFGKPDTSIPHLRALAEENRGLRETAEGLERHARILIDEDKKRERAYADEVRVHRETADAAKRYARSLLLENRKRERSLTEMSEAAQAYAASLMDENRSLREMMDGAQQYAASLLHENEQREQMRVETEQYARSLEQEIQKLHQHIAETSPAPVEQNGPKSTRRRSFAGLIRRLIWSRLSRRPE